MNGAGRKRERLLIQTSTPQAVSVSSLTRSGTTATATTATAHGYLNGDYVTVAGATPSGFNGTVKITVTGASTFTYTVSSGLATPATGTITVTFSKDAQGGARQSWSTLDTIWAEQIPLRVSERLQLQAMQAVALTRFRVAVRADITPKMRALWTPTWPPNAPQQELEIHGVLPDGDGRTDMWLECGAVI